MQKIDRRVARALLAGTLMLAALAAQAGGCAGPWRCEKEIVAPGRFGELIAVTAQHCDGPVETCAAASTPNVTYTWPVTNPDDRNARHQALDAFLGSMNDPIFRLPFQDRAVLRVNGWKYHSGQWHHAVDYAKPGGATFMVRSAAPGTVVFADWNPKAGNTVVVTHDAGGVRDAYRTIYMHLRNGPDNDCAMSWSRGVASINDRDPTLRKRNRDHYKAHLNSSGCPERADRRAPQAAHWGTDEHKLDPALVGRAVDAGDPLGWAGSTGPGGHREAGPPNTHLHIHFARRQASDGRWYVFDPYGIYGMPRCYPQGVTEQPSGYCVRLPVAWEGGRPQYPGNPPACPAAQSLRCPLHKGCYRDPASGNACHRNEAYTATPSCSTPGGQCIWPCTRRGDGSCRRDQPATHKVDCPLECAP